MESYGRRRGRGRAGAAIEGGAESRAVVIPIGLVVVQVEAKREKLASIHSFHLDADLTPTVSTRLKRAVKAILGERSRGPRKAERATTANGITGRASI